MEGENASFEEIMSRIGRNLDTTTVFGEAKQVDGSAIIPVARIRYGGGGGMGGAEQHRTEAGKPEAGEGMGLGFGVTAQPLGVVRVAHDTVEWVPTVDRNRIALIWSVVAGLAVVMAMRALFGGR